MEKTVDSLNSLNIFHQNIRGLGNKSDELMNSFVVDSINSHILCLNEHHMEEQDLLNLTLMSYYLGSSYCHWNLQKGGVCIFVREYRSFNKVGISLHFTNQTLECATELETKSSNLIWALYRVPFSNFNQFIKTLDATLKYLYNPKSEFLICGDINKYRLFQW